MQTDKSLQQIQESLEQSLATFQFQLDSQHDLTDQRLSKLHSQLDHILKTPLNLDSIHDLLQRRLQSLNTDLLSATSKLILLSEQKCSSMIVNECQKILPLCLLACTQTLEKSEMIVAMKNTVERLAA